MATKIMNCPIPEPSPKGEFTIGLPLGAEILGIEFVPMQMSAILRPGQTGQQMGMGPALQLLLDPTAVTELRDFIALPAGADVPPGYKFVGRASIPMQITLFIFEHSRVYGS